MLPAPAVPRLPRWSGLIAHSPAASIEYEFYSYLQMYCQPAEHNGLLSVFQTGRRTIFGDYFVISQRFLPSFVRPTGR